MSNRERVDLYLAGRMDEQTERRTENAMLGDEGLFGQFIAASEQHVRAAPPGFASAVMREIGMLHPGAAAGTSAVSRKMCAAACFCSAAAVMLFTALGLERTLSDLIINYSDKLGALLGAIKFQ